MRLLKSRVAFGFIALVAGFLGGTTLMRYYYERAVSAQLPMQAYCQAIVAAALENHDAARAKEQQRSLLRVTIHALAVRANIYGVDLSRNASALRSVSTYYQHAPDPELTPVAKQFLSNYPGYSRQELDSGHCNSSICQLGKSQPSTQPGNAEKG